MNTVTFRMPTFPRLLSTVLISSCLAFAQGCDDGGDGGSESDSSNASETDDGTTTEGPADVFVDDIYPNIISPNCSCHVGGEVGGLAMPDADTAKANLVSAASGQSSLSRVEPGDPENSYIIHKLKGTQADVGGSGDQMPQGGAALSDGDISSIESWISGL